MKTIMFETNTITVKNTKNGNAMIIFTCKEADGRLKSTNYRKKVALKLSEIQDYSTQEKKEKSSFLCESESLIICNRANQYHFANPKPEIMQEITKKFESHYFEEEIVE